MLSYKVMKLDEYDDAVFYRIACGCSGKDHDFTLWLEHDEKINDVTMMISKDCIGIIIMRVGLGTRRYGKGCLRV